ncbi:YncE family protein [Kitasatospora sp. NPDC004289]
MTADHRPFSPRTRPQDGFTLVELLVVVVILGVLAAVVVFSVRGIGDKGHRSAAATDAATVRTAQEAYCAKNGRYGTFEDLKAAGFLMGEPTYTMMVVGEENKCGKGEKSSFALYDTTAATSRVADAVPAGTAPVDLAVDEKADRVYVAAGGSNAVIVIDGRTDTPVGAPIDVSAAVTAPTRIAVAPGSGLVYVGGTGGVAVIDTTKGNQVTRIGGFTTTVSALAVSPENGDVYVSSGTVGNSAVAYVPAGGTAAVPIPLPVAGLVGPGIGTDFTFDPVHHAVYLAKANVGTGSSEAASIGLYAISSQTRTATVLARFPTKGTCGSNAGDFLVSGSVRGSIAVDPRRNLVYLLAKRCVPNPADPSGSWKNVATTIVVNPVDGTATPVNDPAGSTQYPIGAVYNPTAGSVYVHLDGGSNCGTNNGGRVDRIVGTTVVGQTPVCGVASGPGNPTHRLALLRNFNRVFVAQQAGTDGSGGLAIADGSTLLPRAPLGTPRLFGAVAVNNTTAKVYAVDPANGTVSVFRTGPA